MLRSRRQLGVATTPCMVANPAIPSGRQAIIKAVLAENPPFRPVLGRGAVQCIRGELEDQRRELDLWEETSNSTDIAK